MSPNNPRRSPISDVSGRVSKKRRQLVRNRMLMAVAAVTVLVASVVGWWVLRFSTVFPSGYVSVDGTSTVSKEAIKNAAAVPMGVPLATLDVNAVARRVLTVEQVASVKVKTSFPNQVQIEVTERKPVLTIKSVDGFRLVDESGQAYSLSSTPAQNLPIAAVPGAIQPGTARDLAEAIRAFPPQLKTASLEATTRAGITCTLKNGKSVIWGGSDQSEKKATVVSALMKAVPDAKVYDVSAPARPVTR